MDNSALLMDLSDAFDTVGAPMYSTEFCVWVLAFLAVYGGDLGEQVVLNKPFCTVLFIAQKKLKILGGEVPVCVDELQKAIGGMKSGSELALVWKKKFLERYNLDLPKSSR